MKRASDPASASEINKYIQCPRQWAADYRWDEWLKPTGGMHFALGSAYHKVVESYLRFGILPTNPTDPIAEMFMAALPHLPIPGSATHIEEKEVFEYRGVPYQVTADYVGPGKVVDHKTSKDPARYGLLTKDQKLADAQTILYSFKYILTGGVFDHVYVKKHRAAAAAFEGKHGDELKAYPVAPRAYSTAVTLTQTEIQNGMDTLIHPAGERVYTLRNKHTRIDPLTLPLPTDILVCMNYGGCPYLDKCWPNGYLGPTSDAPVKAESGETLIEKVARLKAERTVGPIQVPTELKIVVSDLEKVLAKLKTLC